MGVIERKEREREEMRQRIMNAARHLFLEQGFEKTSIRGIAEAIEYSPATIYLYYKDKNELLFALHEEAFLKMMAELSKVAAVKDPFERLIEMGNQYIKYALENPELYDLMFIMTAPMETLACRDEIWEDGMKSFCLLQAVVGQCVEAGYFEHDLDIETASLTIWSYMHGLVTIYLKNRMNMFGDDKQVERMSASYTLFIEMIRKGLKE
ncbi:MAG: TetR/AcrR family transcriptional regulator [Cytophagia bacterium]|nr:MAG: TetR/AcrR family transcriptional regulator [Runella sp.]TAG19270.1 MAG: TetR/AcrR family transcriptional regulator [Cytophagales bacterium]TAG38524.1 MAG: TetR/AcrR family transcriptional regulator [Cytophagia bacterium]TAG51611.1 MAG: TetR/AcrR family transcriptional regulator [Runella slithyformis]TAG80121.1 MAG: TetR/AcrR family transcriptional regulator [Cytophagales bacterium]